MKKIKILLSAIAIIMTITVANAQPPMDIEFIGSYTAQEMTDINTLCSADEYWDFLGWSSEYRESFPRTNCDENPDPEASDCDWDNVPWTKKKVTINNIQGYPDCDIYLVYEYRMCPSDPYLIQMNIIGFKTDWWVTGWLTHCDDLNDYMKSGTAEQKARKLDWLESQLYYALGKHQFAKENANHVAHSPGGENIPCDPEGDPAAPLPFKVFYSKGSCTSSMYVQSKDNNGRDASRYYKIDCVDETCCKKWISFCYDENGDLISKTNIDNEPTGCGGYPTPEQMNEIIQALQTLGHTIEDWSPSPCVSSCAD